jgi:hypothetical protein
VTIVTGNAFGEWDKKQAKINFQASQNAKAPAKIFEM